MSLIRHSNRFTLSHRLDNDIFQYQPYYRIIKGILRFRMVLDSTGGINNCYICNKLQSRTRIIGRVDDIYATVCFECGNSVTLGRVEQLFQRDSDAFHDYFKVHNLIYFDQINWFSGFKRLLKSRDMGRASICYSAILCIHPDIIAIVVNFWFQRALYDLIWRPLSVC